MFKSLYELLDRVQMETPRLAAKSHEYWAFDPEGEDPYDDAIKVFENTIAELKKLKEHRHDWNDEDYCNICGADGRA